MYRVKGADQKEYGPVTTEQLIQWIGQNRLNGFSLVQKEGEPGWKPLAQFPEFSATLAAIPAPAPAPTLPVTPPLPTIAATGAAPIYTPVPDPQRATNMVKGPALALILIGLVGILLAVAGLVAKPRLMEVFLEAAQNADLQIPAEQMDMFRAEQSKGTGLRDYFNLGLSLVLYGLVIAGGLKMQRLESWGLALAAAIIAMLPCSCCCCVGIPIGIWAVVVLNRPEVKSSFR